VPTSLSIARHHGASNRPFTSQFRRYIMDFNKLFTATGVDSVPVSSDIPTVKKHLSASQVATFLRERELKSLSKLDRIPWVLRQMQRGVSFTGCGHSDCKLGVYVGIRYARLCFQCKGTGTQTDSDKLRNMKHRAAKDAGVRKGHYNQHKNEYANS